MARSLDFDKADSYASGAVNTEWTTGNGWDPIGIHNSYYRFKAIFDGNGHTISNLYINGTRRYASPAGLFSTTDGSAVIREIGLVNADVTGVAFVGGLVGANSGSVISSYATGNVSGTGAAAYGLAGVGGWSGLVAVRSVIATPPSTYRARITSAGWSGLIAAQSSPATPPATYRAAVTSAGWSGLVAVRSVIATLQATSSGDNDAAGLVGKKQRHNQQ